jgi:hypothetical protein
MTRRHMMAVAASLPAWIAKSAPAAPALRNLGIAPTACSLQAKAARESKQPFDLVEHAHTLGCGGVETRLPAIDAESVKKFRQRIDSYGMRVVLNAPLPKDEAGVAAFDAAVKACKEAGAFALHAALTGRRYEDLHSPRCLQTELPAEPEIGGSGRACSPQAPLAAGH